MYELPVDAKLIQHKINHELLMSKVISGLNGEIYVNYRVEKKLGRMKLIGYIDILNINSGSKTVIEVKSGKEKESHHVQLWMYMSCFSDVRGILRYPYTRYTYFGESALSLVVVSQIGLFFSGLAVISRTPDFVADALTMSFISSSS